MACERCGKCCVLDGKICEHFVTKDGLGFCDIYDDRPMMCRTYAMDGVCENNRAELIEKALAKLRGG